MRGLRTEVLRAGPGAEPQPLAHFCYAKANFERSEALQDLNLNVHCV